MCSVGICDKTVEMTAEELAENNNQFVCEYHQENPEEEDSGEPPYDSDEPSQTSHFSSEDGGIDSNFWIPGTVWEKWRVTLRNNGFYASEKDPDDNSVNVECVQPFRTKMVEISRNGEDHEVLEVTTKSGFKFQTIDGPEPEDIDGWTFQLVRYAVEHWSGTVPEDVTDEKPSEDDSEESDGSEDDEKAFSCPGCGSQKVNFPWRYTVRGTVNGTRVVEYNDDGSEYESDDQWQSEDFDHDETLDDERDEYESATCVECGKEYDEEEWANNGKKKKEE